jgi:FkbM family methyltransferase
MSDLNYNWVRENFVDKNMTVFDIGCANISGDSKMFKNILPNAMVYAFECSKDWESHNLRYAKEYDINYFHIALSDKNDHITFYPSEQYNGQQWPYSGSICKPTASDMPYGSFVWGEPYTVETMRLDTFCDIHNVSPNFIHIDVQGAEYKVLSNLGKHRPWAIWAEVSEFEGWYDTNTTYSSFSQMISDLGYNKIYGSNTDELFVLKDISVTPYYEQT